MKRLAFALALFALTLTSLLSAQGGDPNYKPKRINKMIELLEAGQPVYDISVEGVGYEEGKKLAKERYRSDPVPDGAWGIRAPFASPVHAGAR